MQFSIEWQENFTLVIAIEGVVTQRDLTQLIGIAVGHEKFDETRNLLFDWTAVERIDMTEKDYRVITHMTNPVPLNMPHRRVNMAYIAQDPATIRILQHNIDNYLHTKWNRKILPSREAALAWFSSASATVRN
jgi:hypothetical protein